MTSISKNVYFDKLDDIVKKYKNTNHRTIKLNVDIILPKKVITKILNLKLVIMWEHENIKTFLVPNWSKEAFASLRT